jgi:hypothetical protein
MKSLNRCIVCEPYEGKMKIESSESRGFASIKQKSTLIGLKVLMDYDGKDFKLVTGQKVFIPEEVLHSAPWAKKTYDAEGIEKKFIIVEPEFVSFVK